MKRLDPLIHEPLRLQIMSILYMDEMSTFNNFKTQLDTTDGNLSQHLRKLEDAGYIRVEKTFEGRKPKTYYYLTKKGREKYLEYIKTIEEILKIARSERGK